MDLSLHGHNEATRDWMERGRSNAYPTLDDDSSYNDTPVLTSCLHQLPKNMETQRIYMNGLIQQLVTPTLNKEKQNLVP
jgi:hypothetical protein